MMMMMMLLMLMLTMSAQPNLLRFSIEGKGTDGQINRATARACSPDPVVDGCQSLRRCSTRPVATPRDGLRVRGTGLNAFLLLDDKGREECRRGPPGAELDTLTSARMRSVEHTSQRRGDFFFFFWHISLFSCCVVDLSCHSGTFLSCFIVTSSLFHTLSLKRCISNWSQCQL